MKNLLFNTNLSSEYYRKKFRTWKIVALVLFFYASFFLLPNQPQSAGIIFFVIAAALLVMANTVSLLNLALKAEESIKNDENDTETQYVDRNFRLERSNKTIDELAEEYKKERELSEDENDSKGENKGSSE